MSGSLARRRAPVMVQRTCATAMSDESLRTCTSAIRQPTAWRRDANASVSLLRISSDLSTTTQSR